MMELHDEFGTADPPARSLLVAPVEPRVIRPWRGRGPHWVDMRSLCQTLVDECSARAVRHHVTIDLALCSQPACVIGYGGLLKAAVGRLIHSALDAMPNGGTLTLLVEREPYVLLECSSTASDDIPSTIETTRTIIEAHRGYLWQPPLPHSGIWFIVELPLAGPRSRVSSEHVDSSHQDPE